MARQTQGSIICPKCGRLIGVGEEKCPFCGAWNPGLYGYAPALKRFFGDRFDIIKLIIGACVVLYVVSLVLQPSAIFQMRGLLSFLSPGPIAMILLGVTGSYGPFNPWQNHWWTVFTAIYLHGGLLHLFFNMMSIRNLGPALSEIYGPARLFILFSLTGAAGFLVSNVITGHFTLGASGSVFGLLGALIAYSRRHGSSMMTMQLWQSAIVMFAFGFFMPGVNNWAHGGGFVAGYALAHVLPPEDMRREGVGEQLSALGLLLLTLAGFVLSLLRGLMVVRG